MILEILDVTTKSVIKVYSGVKSFTIESIDGVINIIIYYAMRENGRRYYQEKFDPTQHTIRIIGD